MSDGLSPVNAHASLVAYYAHAAAISTTCDSSTFEPSGGDSAGFTLPLISSQPNSASAKRGRSGHENTLSPSSNLLNLISFHHIQ